MKNAWLNLSNFWGSLCLPERILFITLVNLGLFAAGFIAMIDILLVTALVRWVT